MDGLMVKWRPDASAKEWSDIDVSGLMPKTFESVCHMLGRPNPEVVAMEGGLYFVNNSALLQAYKRKKLPVKTFSDLLASRQDLVGELFSRVRFGAYIENAV